MSGSKDEDKNHLICKTYPGGRGPHYDRWERQMLDAFDGKGDEDSSWAETLQGLDQQAGLSGAQSRRRGQRRRESYSYLLRLQEDEGLKSILRAEANRNGREALLILRRECKDPATALNTAAMYGCMQV